MFDNWIIAPNSQPLNLDFVTKVIWGGDFAGTPTDAQKARLYFFHGIAQVTGQKGSQTLVEFGTEAAALAGREKILQLMVKGGATDLRATPDAAAKQLPSTVTPDVTFDGTFTADPTGTGTDASVAGSVITITGTGFDRSQRGTLVNAAQSVSLPVTYLSATAIQISLALAAGSYDFDYEYIDRNGKTQTIAAAVTLDFS